MSTGESATGVSVARAYFAAQAAAGAVWWLAVFVSDDVRRWTLGEWDPAVLVGPDMLLFVGTSALAALSASRIAGLVTAVWTVGVTAALTLYGLGDQAAGWGVVLMAVATVGTVASAATLWFGYLPTGWFFIGPFSFRVATEKPGWKHLVRSLTQLVVFWATFFVVVPMALSAVERRLGLSWSALDHPAFRFAGMLLLAAGSVIGMWACVTMALRGKGTPLPADTARELVVSGPYRWVRNPMAVAGAGQTMAVGLIVGSWMVMGIAVAGAVIWNVLIRPAEEADLEDRFGGSYRRYTAQVRCWVPARP